MSVDNFRVKARTRDKDQAASCYLAQLVSLWVEHIYLVRRTSDFEVLIVLLG